MQRKTRCCCCRQQLQLPFVCPIRRDQVWPVFPPAPRSACATMRKSTFTFAAAKSSITFVPGLSPGFVYAMRSSVIQTIGIVLCGAGAPPAEWPAGRNWQRRRPARVTESDTWRSC
uniref:(northern house mosquito) hypothetical protein n=1 Tax=Culex pipiens TaxID=7175 RepID=A0A8D8EYL0_CULPI